VPGTTKATSRVDDMNGILYPAPSGTDVSISLRLSGNLTCRGWIASGSTQESSAKRAYCADFAISLNCAFRRCEDISFLFLVAGSRSGQLNGINLIGSGCTLMLDMVTVISQVADEFNWN
jgi:hypothetical protein